VANAGENFQCSVFDDVTDDVLVCLRLAKIEVIWFDMLVSDQTLALLHVLRII